MPRTMTRLNRFSNKGRKVHRKMTRAFLYSLEVDETNTYVHDREATYNFARKLGLDSDLLGKVLACTFEKSGERIEHDIAQANYDKVVKATFC